MPPFSHRHLIRVVFSSQIKLHTLQELDDRLDVVSVRSMIDRVLADVSGNANVFFKGVRVYTLLFR